MIRPNFYDKITNDFAFHEFFESKEYFDNCDHAILKNIQAVASRLQKFRDHIGKPIFVNSGARSVKRNQMVGGKSNSYHLYGLAADIQWPGIQNDIMSLLPWLYANFSGVIWYPEKGFLHVDLGSRIFRSVDGGRTGA